MARRFLWFPTVVSVPASVCFRGLGSGQKYDPTFPELTVGPDQASDVERDTIGGRVTQDSDSGGDGRPNVVVHNTSDKKECDGFDAIADYVFQNSNAGSVLMHHGDLAEIYEMGGDGDAPPLLRRNKPRIVVDENGVGSLVYGGDLSQQLADPVATPSHTPLTPTPRHPGDVNYSSKADPTLPPKVGTGSHPDDAENLKGRDTDPRSPNIDQG